MTLTIDQVRKHMIPIEGNISHMYLDTVGKVTVGIGNMLPSADAAKKLPFVDRTTRNKAPAADIVTDFANVSKQRKAQPAPIYKQFTKLDLPNIEIDNLFRARVAEFQTQLKRYYRSWDEFPPSAQLAILDLAFNLGAAALNKNWPMLNEAIDAQDWGKAASNCERPKAQPVRNSGTVALFRAAIEEKKNETKK